MGLKKEIIAKDKRKTWGISENDIFMGNFKRNLTKGSSKEEVEYTVQAYLLYTLGNTIFTYKRGDRVKLTWHSKIINTGRSFLKLGDWELWRICTMLWEGLVVFNALRLTIVFPLSRLVCLFMLHFSICCSFFCYFSRKTKDFIN